MATDTHHTAELDRFVHELFVSHGAPQDHATPTPKRPRRKVTLPKPSKETTLEVVRDTAQGLLLDSLRDSLIFVGTATAIIEKVGPLATMPILVVLVVIVQTVGHMAGNNDGR